MEIRYAMSIFSKTFAKQFHFPQTVLHEFLWLLPDFFLKDFPPYFSMIYYHLSGHPDIKLNK